MNIFFRELKAYRKSLFFWCLGMLFLVGSGMAKYASIKGDSKAVIDLMAQFPKSIQTIFGLTGFDLTTASGYYGVLFMYIALMAAVHAVLIGAGIIAKEELGRTSEFLFVKPLSRLEIMVEKLTAGLCNLIVLNLVTFVVSLYSIYYFSGEMFYDDLAVLMEGLFLLQLIFFFVGTMMAAVCKKSRLSTTIAASVMLLTFILTMFVNLSEKFDWLKYFTPFKYFEARQLMTSGLDLTYLLITGFLIGRYLMIIRVFVSASTLLT